MAPSHVYIYYQIHFESTYFLHGCWQLVNSGSENIHRSYFKNHIDLFSFILEKEQA